MEFVAKKGEIILMDDGSCYMVLKTIEFENEAYLHVVKTGDSFFDGAEDIDMKDNHYIKQVIQDDECYYGFVEDEALIEKLSNL